MKHYINTITYCSLDLSYILGKWLPLKTLKILHKWQEQSCKQFGELSTFKFRIVTNQDTTNTKWGSKYSIWSTCQIQLLVTQLTLTEAKTQQQALPQFGGGTCNHMPLKWHFITFVSQFKVILVTFLITSQLKIILTASLNSLSVSHGSTKHWILKLWIWAFLFHTIIIQPVFWQFEYSW